jgi:GTP-binding protein Era
MSESSFKSGFISIIGAPNAGKSTLLNRVVGEKLAIISPKPQTTRNRILGVKTTADYQLVLLDTPGVHHAKGTLNVAMVRTALATLATVDLILFVVEAQSPNSKANRHVLQALQRVETSIFLVVNKIDLVGEKNLAQVKEQLQQKFQCAGSSFVSALHGTGVNDLLTQIVALLPTGPPYYPEDAMTDLPERFLCAEIVREKIMHLTSEEIPYSVAVTISSFKEDEQRNIIHIQAEIHVERSSQKGIIIGKRGSMLREIGKQARLDIESLLGTRVFLELWVRVKKQWRKDPRALREFGYQ